MGIGEPSATVDMHWFDLLRAITGRRSIEQLQEMFGDVDARPYAAVISAYELPQRPITV